MDTLSLVIILLVALALIRPALKGIGYAAAFAALIATIFGMAIYLALAGIVACIMSMFSRRN